MDQPKQPSILESMTNARDYWYGRAIALEHELETLKKPHAEPYKEGYMLLLADHTSLQARITELEAQLAQTPTIPPDVRERLAAYAHEAWSGWMRYMFGKGQTRQISIDGGTQTFWLMPAEFFHRWQRQMKTPYAELPESEKASDRDEADKMLAIVGSIAGMPPDVRETLRGALLITDQSGINKMRVRAALAWVDAQQGGRNG